MGQRRRRWANIKPISGQRVVFAGCCVVVDFAHIISRWVFMGITLKKNSDRNGWQIYLHMSIRNLARLVGHDIVLRTPKPVSRIGPYIYIISLLAQSHSLTTPPPRKSVRMNQ